MWTATHPLIGSNNIFYSWRALCENALEIAEDEAKRRLNYELVALTIQISDEIIATAEEY